jgi:hypothetical protein
MGQDLSRCCEAGSACRYSDFWYSQCVPAAQAGGSGGGERTQLLVAALVTNKMMHSPVSINDHLLTVNRPCRRGP